MPESWQLKLDRAREHMDAAKDAVDTFIETKPYALGRELEDEGAKHVYRFTRYSDPPPEIGLRVGDAVHNLRSCLDHLALALAHKGADGKGLTMTREEEADIQFPVVKSPDDFKKQIGRGRLKYVDSGAVDQIRGCQPFHLGDYPRHPLWKVSELDNTDKHPRLPTLGCVVHLDPVLPLGIPEPVLTKPDGWGLGAVIVAYVFPAPYPEVDMKLDPPFSVTLDDAWPPTRPVYNVLGRYIKYVEEYVAAPLAARFL